MAGGSASGLSATSACIVHVLWADDGVTVRLIGAIVQGRSTFIVHHIALLQLFVRDNNVDQALRVLKDAMRGRFSLDEAPHDNPRAEAARIK
jgi:hypothetical protein